MKIVFMLILAAGLLASGCATSPTRLQERAERESLAGAWQAKIRFKTGTFSAIKDLEFLYAFNQGGTMTESSNYDSAPPAPPAYGIWRKVGPGQFEAKYTFYATKPPPTSQDILRGAGWLPAGIGVFVETITLSEDGATFKSVIRYTAFDSTGKPAEIGTEGTGEGKRMKF